MKVFRFLHLLCAPNVFINFEHYRIRIRAFVSIFDGLKAEYHGNDKHEQKRCAK